MKKWTTVFTAVVIAGLIFLSCSGDDNTTEPTNKAPNLTITSPVDCSIYAEGDSILITVEADDEDGYITEVRFYIDNVGVGSDKEFPYSYTHKDSILSVGDHVAKVIVTDNDGKQAFDSINFEIIQKSITFVRTFGDELDDIGREIQQTQDGGYIIVGTTKSYGAGGQDVWLIKTDLYGNEIWSKTFGGVNEDSGQSVQQTTDGGYIIAGTTLSYGTGEGDIWLIKTDVNGNIEWDKTFGGIEGDNAMSVRQTNCGGYIIAGNTRSYGNGGRDIWLVKTDANGNIEWDKTFGGTYDDDAWSVHQTKDLGFIICGSYSKTSSGSSRDVFLVKTDLNGVEEWSKLFDGGYADRGYSVQQTEDEGYILTGYVYDSEATNTDVWLIKTDSYGNLIWEKSYDKFGFHDYAYSLKLTTDSGYIIAGYARTDNFYTDIWLIKTDSNGIIVWDKTFCGGYLSIGWAVQQSSDGGYVIIGESKLSDTGVSNACFIKTDPDGNVK